ncbi:MAG: WbqC family protein [Saprospiraceae bacterium]|nr:WbqC family protein [Saprospiraceae bacterium]
MKGQHTTSIKDLLFGNVNELFIHYSKHMEMNQSASKEILIELQYLAPIQYYSKLLLFDQVWIEQQEHYRKRSFRNRCNIGTAQGSLSLSIPLKKGKHEQMPIREVRVDNDASWQKIHWRSIRTAYGKAPFFEFYAGELIEFYQKKYEFLFDFSWDLQEFMLTTIGIDTRIQKTTEFCKQLPNKILDFRNKINPRDYLKSKDPNFVAYPYSQLFEDRQSFLPNLSILDMLFCTGPETYAYLDMSTPT